METSALTIIFVMIFYLVIIVGVICLQIYLSRRENPYVGLVLPVIFLSLT